MAICLEQQRVFVKKGVFVSSIRLQAAVALLLLLALSCKVWIKLRVIDLGYQLAQVRDDTVKFDMERRELELERSVLLRPDSLQREAQARLGLLPLDARQARKILY